MDRLNPDPGWLQKDIKNAKQLAADRKELDSWLLARLVQLAAGDGSTACRAIETLMSAPTQEGVEYDAARVDALAEQYAVRILRRMGYLVQSPAQGGEDESAGFHPVHDA